MKEMPIFHGERRSLSVMKNPLTLVLSVCLLISLAALGYLLFRHPNAFREDPSQELMADLEKQLSECREGLARLDGSKGSAAQEELEARATALEQSLALQSKLVSELREQLADRSVAVERRDDQVAVSVLGQVLFDFSSTELSPKGHQVLGKVAQALKGISNRPIQVVGHSDSVAIRQDKRDVFASNWELSALRAATVVRFLQSQASIPPSSLQVVGRSYHAPAANNATAHGRARNRRVEILLGSPSSQFDH